MHLFWYYASIFITGCSIAAVLTPVCIHFSKKYGYIDIPNERKLHNKAVPYGGGVAIFLSLSVMVIIAFFVLASQALHDKIAMYIDGYVILRDERIVAIISGAVAIFVLGIVDDLIEFSAKIKLTLQIIIISAVLYFSSLSMSFFVYEPVIGFIGTMLWVVLITNAFNLLDNMDGLCSGVSLLTLAFHFILLLSFGQYVVACLTVMVSAPLFIFFLYNKPSAKVYLGDAGSLMLGYIIAILSVLSTYYREGQHLSSILTPLIILAIPLYDVATVMVIRLKLKQPFFKADKNHFSHRLLKLGMSPAQSLSAILALSAITGISSLLIIKSSNIQAILILLQVLLVFVVVTLLEWISSRQKKA